MQVRCPNCQTAVEVAGDSDLSGLTCSSCGSAFSLLVDPNETLNHEAAPIKRVGRFEVTELIGVGTFGSVWKARDDQLDRWVAIKFPRKQLLSSQETEQFLREARTSAQLKHPNIVAVHEVCRQGEILYIVSDLVDGVTLAEYLSVHPINAVESTELLITVANALHYAHEQGVIHRDLKPSNIMIGLENEPFLLDFGLAKRDAAELTVTIDGRVLGTPAYMSPEQASGESHRADRRSDTYSLGVLLFVMLTGETPFRGNNRMLIHQVINDEPPLPRKLNHAIPRDLETICLKCLEKRPANRYQTALELKQDLERFSRNEPIIARRTNMLEYGWRWCQRRPMVAALSALVILSVAIGISAVTVQWRRANANLVQANEMRVRWEQSFEHAQQAVDQFLTRVSEETLLDEPGMHPLRMRLLSDAREYYRRFVDENSDRPELRYKLAAANLRLARITAEIESKQDGLRMILEVERDAESITFPNQQTKIEFLATVANYLGILYDELGDLSLAEEKYLEAMRGLESIQAPRKAQVASNLANCHHNIGWLYDRKGTTAKARDHYQIAVSLYETLLEKEPDNLLIQRSMASTIGNQAILLQSIGEIDDALTKNAESISRLEVIAHSATDRNKLAANHANRALILRMRGQLSEALESAKDSVDIRELVANANPSVSVYQNHLAMSYINYGMMLLENGDFTTAQTYYTQAIAIYEKLLQVNSGNIEYEIAVGVAHHQFASILQQRDQAAAEDHYQQAAARLQNALERAPEHRTARQQLADLYLSFGGYEIRRDNLELAIELLQNSLSTRESLEPRNPLDYYNDACSACLIAKHITAVQPNRTRLKEEMIELAVNHVRQSIAAGFTHFDHMRQDADLDIIRDHPEFIMMMDAISPAHSDQ